MSIARCGASAAGNAVLRSRARRPSPGPSPSSLTSGCPSGSMSSWSARACAITSSAMWRAMRPRSRRARSRSAARPTRRRPRRLERQRQQTLEAMLAELPTGCDIGTKRNSKGFAETWIGYKLHLDVSDGMVPIAAVLTAASTHDSQAALPLTRVSQQRVVRLYDIMASAYDAEVIIADCLAAGRVPVIDFNTRRDAAPKV